MSDPSYTYHSERQKHSMRKQGVVLPFRIRLLRVVLIIIVLALFLEASYYFIILPITATARFVFDLRDSSLTEPEVRRMLALQGDEKWGSLDSTELATTLNSYPIIEAAYVKKKFPDKIFLKIVERRPVAVSFVNMNGKLLPLEIDKDGVIFRMGWNENTSLFTIVSGLNFKNPKAGMKINYQLLPLFKRLDFLIREKPLLLTSISEIKIREKKHGDYDLVLYPTYKKVKVLSGKDLSEKTLNRMILTLDVVADERAEQEIDYIDIRGVNIVYKWKEMSDE